MQLASMLIVSWLGDNVLPLHYMHSSMIRFKKSLISFQELIESVIRCLYVIVHNIICVILIIFVILVIKFRESHSISSIQNTSFNAVNLSSR